MRRRDDTLKIMARPTPLTFGTGAAAVIVVDMQNDFGSVGGMFSRARIPIDGIQSVVEPTARVVEAARQAEMPVVYLVMQFDAALALAGNATVPNRIKHTPLGVGDAVDAPDGTKGRVLVGGTWNTKIIDALAPQPGDLVVAKHRYSGFYGTDLDERLRDLGVDTLVVTGCTTSVCVDSTVRDAFFRDYRCIVLEDCVAEPLGSDTARWNHEATLLTIETLFGWVSSSGRFIEALSSSALRAGGTDTG